jgi:hypothetical protein
VLDARNSGSFEQKAIYTNVDPLGQVIVARMYLNLIIITADQYFDFHF